MSVLLTERHFVQNIFLWILYICVVAIVMAHMFIFQDMKTVEVIQGSESYMDVEKMFHRTMHAPRAEIVRIRRVQNPILWQFYSV